MKSIMEAVILSTCNIADPELLQLKLKENLNGKKFLLVLDDVWSEESHHHEFLGQLLYYRAQGSKILVSKSSERVASAMHANAAHHLNVLPIEDCWSLFRKTCIS